MKKLGMRGFAHHLALMLVVVITGIAGVTYLYMSNADTYGNPLSSKSICQGSHYHRTWKNGTCSKTCQSGYHPIVSNPYDYCAKNGSAVGNPLSSKSICEGPNYHRVWKSGTCSKSCQTGYTHIVADPYDYCKKGGSGGSGNGSGSGNTSTNPLNNKALCEGSQYHRTWKNGTCSKTCQSGYTPVTANPYDYCKKKVTPTTNKITVNGKTSTNGKKLSFNFNKATYLKIKVYGGKWKLCSYDGYIDLSNGTPSSGVTCHSLPTGSSTWGATGSVYVAGR